MPKSVFLFLMFCIWSIIGKAQTGCIIVFGVNSADTKVYTTLAGGTSTCNGQTVTKYRSTNFITLTAGCSWSPNPAASPGTLRNCIVGSSCGVAGTYTQQCPLDTNSLFFGLIVGAVGAFALYKSSLIGSLS